MGAEAYAFCEGMDIGTAFRIALRPILGRKVDLNMCIDSKGLFDTITRLSQTAKKRLMIDIATAMEAYREKKFPMSDGYVWSIIWLMASLSAMTKLSWKKYWKEQHFATRLSYELFVEFSRKQISMSVDMSSMYKFTRAMVWFGCIAVRAYTRNK